MWAFIKNAISNQSIHPSTWSVNQTHRESGNRIRIAGSVSLRSWSQNILSSEELGAILRKHKLKSKHEFKGTSPSDTYIAWHAAASIFEKEYLEAVPRIYRRRSLDLLHVILEFSIAWSFTLAAYFLPTTGCESIEHSTCSNSKSASTPNRLQPYTQNRYRPVSSNRAKNKIWSFNKLMIIRYYT